MRYPGGKNSGGAYQRIISQMPPHDIYIEPFLGSGAVLRNKRPARLNIGIDKDSGAIDAFNYAGSRSAGIDDSGYAGAARAFIVRCDDGISFLESYQWQGNELVYCDPPYLLSSRRQNSRIYLCEMTEDDHRRLLAIIKTIPAMIMISGYYSKLYMGELRGWRYITWQAMTRGGKPATEYLWMNYPEPLELHDYSHLGVNFTDRQRIKRKKQRWLSKLQGMPTKERYAVMAAIDELKAGENHSQSTQI